jgi:hypothetical protein
MPVLLALLCSSTGEAESYPDATWSHQVSLVLILDHIGRTEGACGGLTRDNEGPERT